MPMIQPIELANARPGGGLVVPKLFFRFIRVGRLERGSGFVLRVAFFQKIFPLLQISQGCVAVRLALRYFHNPSSIIAFRPCSCKFKPYALLRLCRQRSRPTAKIIPPPM